MTTHKTASIVATSYFALTAVIFALTLAFVFYTSARSSGDNLGSGPIGIASVVLFIWSVVGATLARSTSLKWARLSEALRLFRCLFILVAFAAPTGVFAWFACYLMISYSKT